MAEVTIVDEQSAPNCKQGIRTDTLSFAFAAGDASKAATLTFSTPYDVAPTIVHSVKTFTAGGNLTDIKTVYISTAPTTTAVILTAIANAAPGGTDTAALIIDVTIYGVKP